MFWADLAWVAGLGDDEMDEDAVGAAAACYGWFHHLVRALAGVTDRGEDSLPVLQAARRAVDVFPGIVLGTWCMGAELIGDYSQRYREVWQRTWVRLFESAGYVEGIRLGYRRIEDVSGTRPVVFARRAPRPERDETLFRTSNHLGRFGIAWTSSLGYIDAWRVFESCVRADGGVFQRAVYRFEARPADVLARLLPNPEHKNWDEWVVAPGRLNDATVRKMP
jgi:hypothetical protein